MDVTLRVRYSETKWGEYVGVVGEGPYLGDWSNPVALACDHFPVWSVTVRLPGDNTRTLSYKFVVCGPDASSILRWEPVPHNRSLNIPQNADFIICDTAFGSLPSNISRSYENSTGLINLGGVCAPKEGEKKEQNINSIRLATKGVSDPENDQSAPNDTPINIKSPLQNAQSPPSHFAPTPNPLLLKRLSLPVRYTSPRGIMDDIYAGDHAHPHTVASDLNFGCEPEEGDFVSDKTYRLRRTPMNWSPRTVDGALSTGVDDKHTNTSITSTITPANVSECNDITTTTQGGGKALVRRNLAAEFLSREEIHDCADQGTTTTSNSSVVSESDLDEKRREHTESVISAMHQRIDHDLETVGYGLAETLAMAEVARKRINEVASSSSISMSSSSNNATPVKDNNNITASKTLSEELTDALENAHEIRRLMRDVSQAVRELDLSQRRRRRARSTRN